MCTHGEIQRDVPLPNHGTYTLYPKLSSASLESWLITETSVKVYRDSSNDFQLGVPLAILFYLIAYRAIRDSFHPL